MDALTPSEHEALRSAMRDAFDRMTPDEVGAMLKEFNAHDATRLAQAGARACTTRVKTLTSEQARAERDRLEATMLAKYGTADWDTLQQITFSGALTWDEIAQIERYDTLCYFTSD